MSVNPRATKASAVLGRLRAVEVFQERHAHRVPHDPRGYVADRAEGGGHSQVTLPQPDDDSVGVADTAPEFARFFAPRPTDYPPAP